MKPDRRARTRALRGGSAWYYIIEDFKWFRRACVLARRNVTGGMVNELIINGVVIRRMAMVNVAVPAREYARPPGARHRPQPAPTSQIHGFLEAKCAAKAF